MGVIATEPRLLAALEKGCAMLTRLYDHGLCDDAIYFTTIEQISDQIITTKPITKRRIS